MRLWVRSASAGAAVWITLFVLSAGAIAQPSQSSLDEAERLRNSGQFQAAVRLLEAHLTRHPDDVTAIRRLAQTLYWMQEAGRARGVYEGALLRHPEHPGIRLDYGRMLLETGDRSRARTLVAPLLEEPDARGEASALLGTLNYWEGDLTSAQRLFRDAIAAGADGPDVRRQLHEIEVISASWLRVSPVFWHDDQPRDRTGALVEAGWFLTPLVPLQVRFEPMRYASNGSTHTVWAGDVRVSAYVPSARFDVETAAGFVRRSQREPTHDWTWRLAAGPRLENGVTLRGRVGREAYFHTTASLDSSVMVTTLAVQIRLDNPRGWLGEAEHRHQRFFDSNIVRATYGWFLAPFVHTERLGAQVGYALARSDSDELRFVVADSRSAAAMQELDGRYDPYHTPLNQVTHSALAAVRVSSARGTTLRVSGSYGFRAEEDFPFFTMRGALMELTLDRRRFRPWSGRGALEFRVHEGLTVSLSGEAGRTAFYKWATAGVHLTYRFIPDESLGR